MVTSTPATPDGSEPSGPAPRYERLASIEEQVDRFLAHLEALSNQEALHTSGVLSTDFWLKRVLSKDFCGSA